MGILWFNVKIIKIQIFWSLFTFLLFIYPYINNNINRELKKAQRFITISMRGERHYWIKSKCRWQIHKYKWMIELVVEKSGFRNQFCIILSWMETKEISTVKYFCNSQCWDVQFNPTCGRSQPMGVGTISGMCTLIVTLNNNYGSE